MTGIQKYPPRPPKNFSGLAYYKINIKHRNFPIAIQISLVQSPGTQMAVHNRLEILLFQQWRYQVVELSFPRASPERFR